MQPERSTVEERYTAKVALLQANRVALETTRKRAVENLLIPRLRAVDAAQSNLAAEVATVKDAPEVAGASAEELAALKARLAIFEAKLTAEVESCSRRLDIIENSPPRAWQFDVIRDDAGQISGVVANPVA